MSEGEYQELVEFLARKFARIDERFDRIDQRFVQIDERFDGIDQRFVQIDERFDGIDQRFVQVDERFDRTDERSDGMEARLTRIEVLFEQQRDDIQAVAEGVVTNGNRIDALRNEMKVEFRAQRQHFEALFQGLDRRVTRLEE